MATIKGDIVIKKNLYVEGGSGVEIGADLATNRAGVIKLWSAGANNFYSTLTAGTQTANADYTLPTALPASNKFLQSTNAGVLSWEAAGGSGKMTAETKTDNYTVTTADTGKLLVMNSALDKTFSLPSVDASDVGTHFYFAKIGAGRVTIDATDSDKIADSGAGDTIYNDQAGEVYATIHLVLTAETQWSIYGSDGIWTTTD